jgi:hypothetical protein
MPEFKSRQRAGFSGVQFPVTGVRIRGVYRDHTHEYLKTDGGANEKLGRSVYLVEMDAEFHAGLDGYPNLYPLGVQLMRKLFEKGITDNIVIPTLGTLRGYQTSWDQDFDARVQSGEKVHLRFKEDSVTGLEQALAKIQQSSLPSAAARLDLAASSLDPKPSIFDDIQSAANDVFAIRDQAQLQGALIQGKIDALAGIIREADRDVRELQDPTNYAIVDALHELLEATIDLARDATANGTGPRLYSLPQQMSVSQISTALYGDATHAVEIMQNNNLVDPFAVPAGTTVIWFPTADFLAA